MALTESPATPHLRRLIAPLRPWLAEPSTEEIAINRPGEAWVRQRGNFTRHDVALDLQDLQAIAVLAGALRRQDVGWSNPLLAAELPDGERIQVCLFPVVPHGRISLTLRKPGAAVVPLADAGSRYGTAEWNNAKDTRRARDMDQLLALFASGNLIAFLEQCVHSRLNMLLTGPTGSGKTTLAKSLVAAIDPEERLITIEDVLELVITQPNHVRLLFQRDDAADTVIDPEGLLQACLRMRPDRVFLAEIRGPEAWTYVTGVMPPHPGSISTIHGHSAASALRRLFALCKSSPAGASLDDRTLGVLLADTVDVVVPLREDRGAFSIAGVWFIGDALRRGESAVALLQEG
jgi:type IV secretion system protein VirB11